MSLLTPLLAAALSSAPTTALDVYNTCMGNNSTNGGYEECGEAYLKRLDDALNVEWKKAYASVDKSGRAQLLREQRAWIGFKDVSCQFYSNPDFGRDGQVYYFYKCRSAILQARIADLRSIYDVAHENDAPPR